jgi:hypothetical protein
MGRNTCEAGPPAGSFEASLQVEYSLAITVNDEAEIGATLAGSSQVR